MFQSLLEKIINVGIFGNNGSGKSMFVKNLLSLNILEENDQNNRKTRIYTKENKFQDQLYEKEDHKTYSNPLLFQEDHQIYIIFISIKNDD